MAVTTRDKRMSLIGFGVPIPTVLPNPDGTIGTLDRFMFEWLYAGITLEGGTYTAITLHAQKRPFALHAIEREFALRAQRRPFTLHAGEKT